MLLFYRLFWFKGDRKRMIHRAALINYAFLVEGTFLRISHILSHLTHSPALLYYSRGNWGATLPEITWQTNGSKSLIASLARLKAPWEQISMENYGVRVRTHWEKKLINIFNKLFVERKINEWGKKVVSRVERLRLHRSTFGQFLFWILTIISQLPYFYNFQ